MLVVISDLHFEEEALDVIPGDGDRSALGVARNVPSRAYRGLVSTLAAEAVRNGARRLDLVLAGDVFDLRHTSLWFRRGARDGAAVRPYVGTAKVDSRLEAKVLEIIAAIAAEPEVAEALEVFRLLARGRYRVHAGGSEPEGEDRDFPVPVTIHYLPGNHDRLAGATPRIRREVRRLLGLEGGEETFPHALMFEDPRVLVRHGHEYDRFNSSTDHRGAQEIPARLPAAQYGAPPLGDFITTEVAVRFAALFREVHGDENVLRSGLLSKIYLRLLEFDDLRPQSALLHFLLTAPEIRSTPKDAWRTLVPVAQRILEDVYDHPFLRGALEGLKERWLPGAIDAIRVFLDLKAWRLGIPLPVARLYTRYAVREETQTGPRMFAAREAVVRDGSVSLVVAGHSHNPQVALLASGGGAGERYFVDTGTWRNRIPSTPDLNGFGKLGNPTHVVVYASDEGKSAARGAGGYEPFDYWSGFARG